MDRLHVKAESNTIIDEKNRMVLGVVGSSGVIDRHGESVNPMGWELQNYLKNPVLMFGHDYSSFPVGKALKVYIEDNKLKFDLKFADTEEGVKTFNLIKDGFLNTTSVGFIPKEWGTAGVDAYSIMKQELLELSVVPVPANPEALIQNSIANENFKSLEILVKKMEVANKEKKLAEEKKAKEEAEAKEKERKANIVEVSKDLFDEMKNQVEELKTIKAGRVLSEKNRSLIQTAITQMDEAVSALKDLLSATEPEKGLNKNEKSDAVLQSIRDLMRNSDKKLGTALKELNKFVVKT